MTLSHTFERTSSDSPAPSSPPRAGGAIDLRQLVRRPPVTALRGQVLDLVPTPGPKPAPEPATPPAARPKSDMAFGLLDQLSTALPALVERKQALELQVAQGAVDLAATREEARSLQELTERLKVQIAHLEADNIGLGHRLRAAEEDAQRIQARADEAQRLAAQAECLSSLFEDKVIAAFGAGSQGHSILESVRHHT